MKSKSPSDARPTSSTATPDKAWPASHIPRYVVIADRLRQRIASGAWRAGTLLPSLHALADEFAVARPTARQAVQILVQEGLLSSQRGQGTFVTQAATPVKTTPLETSLQALAATYHGLKPKILEIDETPRPLPCDPDGAADYVYMRRLHSLDGRPYCVISLYIAQDVFNAKPAQLRTQPIIPVLLALKGLRIKQAHQTLSIASADAETAGLLGIPAGAPLANMTRVFRSQKGKIVYYAEVSYRGDAVRIEIDLKP
ncbi:UTRA domain-containing protein [Pusillimonas sp. TS35]|uniref:GntR family transcriptional regulator n=1 Tax=Paracandidimonas lactea TaxID=2895524 RepID=UPI001367EA74|nr:GntR family transcriptional regulator [Paracandidimonas lactea]MYN14321.1 UTRA domain-containing protein [Pusillimonas sp. TS35]